jgi:hypothetical protein
MARSMADIYGKAAAPTAAPSMAGSATRATPSMASVNTSLIKATPAAGETPSQANARILASLGLDTVLTPKRKKQLQATAPELVNLLGE